MRWSGWELRPSVTTAGCSSRSSRSFGRRPSIRAWASERCHSSASAYGTTPACTTSSRRAVTTRPPSPVPRPPPSLLRPTSGLRPCRPQRSAHPRRSGREAEQPVRDGGEESDEQRSHSSEHADDAALPQVLQRPAAAPAEHAGHGDSREQPGEQRVARRLAVVVGIQPALQQLHDQLRECDRRAPEPRPAGEGAEPDSEGVSSDLGHMSTTRPSESSAAWATASDIVGCALIASSTSSTVYSFSRATASSWMISDACPPTMWAPKISPYFLSRRIL